MQVFLTFGINPNHKMVELAGVEPASRKRQPLVLHA